MSTAVGTHASPVGAAPAYEATPSPDATGVIIEGGSTVLSLEFDEPIPAEDAADAADEIAGSRDTVSLLDSDATPDDRSTSRGQRAVAAAASGARLSCGNGLAISDSNGRLTLDYRCDLSPKRTQWSCKLSAAVARIVVGTVREDGLRWWKNGASMPTNAPHVVSPLYTFHGTMNPTPINSDIDYQDVITFRHNIGSGGTGRVVWAGSVVLKRTEESD